MTVLEVKNSNEDVVQKENWNKSTKWDGGKG